MRHTVLALGTAALALAPLVPAPAVAHVGAVARIASTTSSAPVTGMAPTSTRPVTAAARSRELRYVSRVKTSKRIVFITIDDGVVRDKEFLKLVQRTHLPVTVFLTLAYASPGAHARYFRRLQAAGAVIENHTLTHPDLRRVGDRQLRREICTAAAKVENRFGRSPTLFRAPYGAYDDRVLRTARSCGMTTVGWDAVMPERGPLETWNGHGRLNPGDVVLLHFVPGLVGQLKRVLAEAERRHLKVAQLEDYVRPPR